MILNMILFLGLTTSVRYATIIRKKKTCENKVEKSTESNKNLRI